MQSTSKLAAKLVACDSLSDLLPEMGLVIVSEDGTIEHWSSGAQSITSLPASSAVGCNWQELIRFEDAPCPVQVLQRLSENAAFAELGLAGDSLRNLAFRASARSVNDNGTVQGYCVRLESLPAELPDDLCRSLNLRLFDHVSEAVLVSDLSGKVIYSNPSARSLWGCNEDELVGQSINERLRLALAGEASAELLHFLDNRPWSGEIRATLRDGRPLRVSARVERLCDAHKNCVATFHAAHDLKLIDQLQSQLSEVDRHLTESQEIARIASWGWDATTDKVWWSPAIYKVFGLDPEKVEPSFEHFLSLLHPDDRSLVYKRVQEVLAGTDVVSYDMRLIRPDGKCIWINSRARAAKDAQGRTLRVDGIDQDITERKTAERALAESEQRYRTFVDHSLDSIFIFNRKSLVVDVNAPACESLGYSRDELIGVHPSIFDREYSIDREAHLLEQLSSGKPVTFETNYVRSNGTIFPVEVRLSPFAESGSYFALGIVRDLTKWKEAQQHLLQTEKRLYQIGDNVPGGMIFQFELAPESEDRLRVLYISQSCLSTIGYSAEQLSASPRLFFDMLSRSELDDFLSALNVSKQNMSPLDLELNFTRPNGETKWVHARATPALNNFGRIVWEGVAVDLTEQKRAENALRVSEERYRMATMATNDAIWDIDLVTGKVTWNEHFAVEYGRPMEANNKGWWEEHIHPDDRERIVKSLSQAIDSKQQLWSGDYRFRHADGSWAEVEDRAYITRDANGVAVRVVGAIRNVTRRKTIERALRESESRFRSVLDHSPAAVFLKNLQGQYLFVNEQFARSCNMPATMLVGKRAQDIFDEQTAAGFLERDAQLLRTMTPLTDVQAINLPCGVSKDVFGLRFLIKDAEGKPYAICGIATDISEQKRTQEERDRLWNHSPDLVLIAGSGVYIRQLNPAWKKTLGWELDQMLGRKLLRLVHPDDLAQVRKILDGLSRTELVSNIVLRLRASDSGYRWLSGNVLYVPSSNVVYAFMRDVTQQKRLEEQYQQAQKMEAIGQLAGGIAHDFNNLLTIIGGYSDILLRESKDNDMAEDALLAMRDACDRAAALTAQLLAFSRKAIIEPKVLDLNESVEQSARLLRRLIGEDILLQTRLARDLWKVKIDPVQLEQTLMNLAVNARDAMPCGGVLSIETSNFIAKQTTTFGNPKDSSSNRYVRLVISDSGHGMTEEVKNHLFEPFFTTKGVGKGTGLGLATVYGIVHQAGGCIHAESSPGNGAEFQIYLPAVLEAASKTYPSLVTSWLRGTETILIAEDEEAVRNLAKLILEMHGYNVIHASSGRDALQAANQYAGTIDLLLSDVVMPDLSGRQLADEIRSLRPGVRVLYMSGYTDDAVVRSGVASATDAFLPKPFTPGDLTQRVRKVLDS